MECNLILYFQQCPMLDASHGGRLVSVESNSLSKFIKNIQLFSFPPQSIKPINIHNFYPTKCNSECNSIFFSQYFYFTLPGFLNAALGNSSTITPDQMKVKASRS